MSIGTILVILLVFGSLLGRHRRALLSTLAGNQAERRGDTGYGQSASIGLILLIVIILIVLGRF